MLEEVVFSQKVQYLLNTCVQKRTWLQPSEYYSNPLRIIHHPPLSTTIIGAPPHPLHQFITCPRISHRLNAHI
jgi:hypothetical protein